MTDLARLTSAEVDYLAQCEETISHGLQTFVEVGTALAMIRDNKLYRVEHETFDAYCAARWGFTDRRARQLIDAAAIGNMFPVENSRQAAELARVPEPERADVWQAANDNTGGKPTAAAIRDAFAATNSPTGTDAIASSAALRTRPDQSGPEEVEPASEGGCGSTSSTDAGVNPALVEALAKAAQRRDEVERHNAWARDVNEQIPAETKAELAELDRVIAPVNRITNGCAFLLDVVKDVNPELAVAETPEQLRHKLAVVHDALAFLTRVADAMKPQEIAA